MLWPCIDAYQLAGAYMRHVQCSACRRVHLHVARCTFHLVLHSRHHGCRWWSRRRAGARRASSATSSWRSLSSSALLARPASARCSTLASHRAAPASSCPASRARSPSGAPGYRRRRRRWCRCSASSSTSSASCAPAPWAQRRVAWLHHKQDMRSRLLATPCAGQPWRRCASCIAGLQQVRSKDVFVHAVQEPPCAA